MRQVQFSQTPMATEAIEFDHEDAGSNLWAVMGGVPVDRALLEALVISIGVADRLALAEAFPLEGDAARAQALLALAALAALDASMPALSAGSHSAMRKVLEAAGALRKVAERLVEAEEPGAALADGALPLVDLANTAKRCISAARSSLEGIEVEALPDGVVALARREDA